MDEIQKLKEHAGIREDAYEHEQHINALNELSNRYRFDIDEYGPIDIYDASGNTHIGTFEDFDTMIKDGLRIFG